MNIPVYKTIEELHSATGFDGKPVVKGFHIFRHEETYPSVREFMPPFRKSFYQITLLENPGNSYISINGNKIEPKTDIVYFHGPQHVFSFKRDSKLKGFIIYFSKDFFQIYPGALNEFSFFELNECNVFTLCSGPKEELKSLMTILLKEQNSSHFSASVIQAHLLALLFKAKAIFIKLKGDEALLKRSIFITQKFKRLVDNFFLKNNSVDYYAGLLNISAKHLSDVVKQTTGKPPRQIINERLLIEAKNLLKYSDLNVTEVALQLGFADAASFGKFFKRAINNTASNFRNS